MWRYVLGLMLGLGLVLLLAVPLLARRPAGPEVPPQTLEEVLALHEAALPDMTEFYVRFEYRERTVRHRHELGSQLLHAGGQCIRTGTKKLWVTGAFKRQYHDYQEEYPTRDALMVETMDEVSTPRLYLRHMKSMDHITMYHRPAKAGPKDSEMYAQDIAAGGILLYGFGDGHESLRSLCNNFQKQGHAVTIEETQGIDPTLLLNVAPDEGSLSGTRHEIELSPNRGYLITAYRSFHKTKGLIRKLDVQPRRVGEQWVPGEVRDWRLRGPLLRMSLIDLRLGNAMPDSSFSLEAFKLDPERVTVLSETKTAAAKPQTWAFYQGTWFPKGKWTAEMNSLMRKLPPGATGMMNGTWLRGGPTDPELAY